MEANSLSKAGLWLDLGKWQLIEDRNGEHFEYYHKPFVEENPTMFLLHNRLSISSILWLNVKLL
jgi:hypothetical protein